LVRFIDSIYRLSTRTQSHILKHGKACEVLDNPPHPDSQWKLCGSQIVLFACYVLCSMRCEVLLLGGSAVCALSCSIQVSLLKHHQADSRSCSIISSIIALNAVSGQFPILHCLIFLLFIMGVA
jgi:hypothetical protein